METPVSPSPVPPTVYVPASGSKKLFSKRNIILIIFLLILVGALPVGVYLTQKTQIFKSKAAGTLRDMFSFSSAGIITPINPRDPNNLGYTTTTKDEITMELSTEEALIKTLFLSLIPSTSPAPSPLSETTLAPTATLPPKPTATITSTPASTPTATPAQPSPLPPLNQPIAAIGYCSNNTLTLTWDTSDTVVDHYNVDIPSFRIAPPYYVSKKKSLSQVVTQGTFNWLVQACDEDDQCSVWTQGKPVTCQ